MNALTFLYRSCAPALLLALLPLAVPATAAEPAQGTVSIQTGSLRVEVTAVDADVFHITASPVNGPIPPISPFVVEMTSLKGAKIERSSAGATLHTPKAELHMDADGGFTVTTAGGTTVIRRGHFTTTANGVTLALDHGADQRLYGAGNADMNVSGDLTHPSGEQTTRNGATRIPFLWSTGGYGVLIANDQTGISWADTRDTLTWTVPGHYADVYVMATPGSGYGVLDAYSRLTGRAPLPPRWTFGFMMSRWGYADAADIQDKWHQFRDRKIPVDAFIYDYDWFVDDWKFDTKKFPAGSLDTMHKMGLKFVGIRKPRINGENLDYATRQTWTIKSQAGTDLRFDLPEARYWWWGYQAPLMTAGVDAWWNDEAEQSYDEFFRMAQTQWEGQRSLNHRRVWNLNRAFAPGMQRFGAACWTGDISSRWDTLANQPGTMLNWSLSGMPFVGQDIGGFFGPPTPELYARWMEEGVFVPVMRSHGMLDESRWPWAFGAEAQDAMIQAINLRYRLIPYLYTTAEQTTRTGAPMMRPLVLDYPDDPKTFHLADQWMLGDAILAAPILTEGGSRSVYLPRGLWYDFATNAKTEGGKTLQIEKASLSAIPVYIRAGSILPLGPVLQSTSLGAADPLEVRVYPGTDGSFSLYEDGGDDYSYTEGHSATIPFRWDDRHQQLTIGKRTGMFPGMLTERHITVVLPGGKTRSVLYDGRSQDIRF